MKETNRKRAVALRYEAGRDRAPRVSAKGAGQVAEKIIELARSENIPISEDPDLVSALIQLDFYAEVPPELYRAVAEILAFAYRVNRKLKARAGRSGKKCSSGLNTLGLFPSGQCFPAAWKQLQAIVCRETVKHRPCEWAQVGEGPCRPRSLRQAMVPGMDGMFVAEFTGNDQRKGS